MGTYLNIVTIILIDMISRIIQIVPFHLTIFTPSNGPNGRRLNVAKTEFIKHKNPKN